MQLQLRKQKLVENNCIKIHVRKNVTVPLQETKEELILEKNKSGHRVTEKTHTHTHKV